MLGSIVDVPGISVGHDQDHAARTGCTVVLMPEQGAVGGVDVRGAAPGTRETDALGPTARLEVVHAFVLAGGSAFGLDAAGGTMAFLEERGIGYAVGRWRVPIVPSAIIFDLLVGDGRIRPDRAMGYRAAALATRGPVEEGSVGAGCGATAGKLGGIENATKSGVGTASRRFDELVVGALTVCNAVGSVYDTQTREQLAGPRELDGGFIEPSRALEAFARWGKAPPAGGNTTLAVVACNARLRKVDVIRVAQMAHDGLARAVLPAHLSRDGDTIFACATGAVEASVDVVGALAAEAVAEAIARGIRASNRPR